MSAAGALLDVRPLRTSAAYRRLWIGTAGSSLGSQVAVVAVLYQVWQLTSSAAWTGAIGIVTAVPQVAFGLFGGVLADAVDRRRLVGLTATGSVAAAVLLALQAGLGAGSLPLVLVLVAVQTACAALGAAARRTFGPRLLPRELVPAGVALDHVSFQVSMLAGPALAGLVLARSGLAACYAVDALSTAAALYGVARLPAHAAVGPGPGRAGASRVSLRATVDGWRFLAGRPALRGAVAADLAATVLAMPVALFPVLNAQRFGGDPATLGLFLSAIAVGGTLAGLASGAVTAARRPGAVLLTSVAVWGGALACFGAVQGLAATLACLAVAGAADTVSVVSRGTLVQLDTPDAYLGRVSSVENVVGVAGPGVGNARAGAVASLTSASSSAVTGGLACVLAAVVLALALPPLRRWSAPGTEQPVAQT